MINLGNVKEDAIVCIPFNTSDADGASITITNLVDTDVHIHKDDDLGARNNAAGITVSIDFDGITGNHLIKIDTGDDTVVGFWVVGHDYFVRIEGTTIDAQTVNAWIAMFSIENRFDEVNVAEIAGTAVPNTAGKIHVLDDEGNTIANESKQDDIVADAAAILIDTDELQADWKNGGRLDNILDARATVDGVLDGIIEDTLKLKEVLRLCLAALAGKSAGGGTSNVTFRDKADGKDRITATVDDSGNRTTGVLDES